MNERACQAVIPPTSKRKLQRAYDRHVYKWRHLLENVFCNLKEFKKIAMPSEKTDRSFATNIYLAAILMALR
ncbi:transposase [Suttonella indologenes]|uniref:transposase n=1 Tax=Suttonella indologenes TaxID=13276 RepID=UPI003CCC8B12